MKNLLLYCGNQLKIVGLLGVVLLASCSVQEIQQTAPFNAHDTWVMLPFNNHSDTPEAGEKAADIAETLFRSQRGVRLVKYRLADDDNQLPELNQQKILNDAVKWGQQQNYHYGLSGSIQEWRYKSGLDGEPAVGVTLNVIDLTTGDVLWSASGSRTGWGRESVSGTGLKLMTDLLDGLPLTE